MLQEPSISPEKRALWEQLFADMSQFHDFRDSKAKAGADIPDFVRKDSGGALW